MDDPNGPNTILQQNDPNAHSISNQGVSRGGTSPEHEPLAFHFGSMTEQSSSVESTAEQAQPTETLPSPLNAAQPYTPPILNQSIPNSTPSQSNATIVAPHPPLPLTDTEIEDNVKSKATDSSIHWLALWCLRQLEIYQKSVEKK